MNTFTLNTEWRNWMDKLFVLTKVFKDNNEYIQ